MNKEGCLFIIPGIREHVTLVEKFIENRYPSMEVIIYRAPWAGKGASLDLMKQDLKGTLYDLNLRGGSPLVVVATSSSSSFVTYSYPKISPYADKFVFVCGRLSGWSDESSLSFKLAAMRNRLYCESVQACERNLDKLTADDRKKFMTMRPWVDLQVPPQTCVMEGAKNVRIPMVGHVSSIAYALIFMNKEIVEFASGR